MTSNSEVVAMEGTAGEVAGGGERQRLRQLLRQQGDTGAEDREQGNPLMVSPPARKDGFTSAKQLRGLGCLSAAAAQAYSPSSAADMVWSSADWHVSHSSVHPTKKASAVAEIWCAPGIAFASSADDPVDCVVSQNPSRGVRTAEGERMAGERTCIDRRRGRRLEHIPPFLDSLPENTIELPKFRSDQMPECRISSHGGLQEAEEEDDWVIVKKQKITILIPPPPITSPIAKNDKPSMPDIKPFLAQKTSSHPQEHNFYFPLIKPIGAVKQRIRALNFERRLQRIGGLKRYLSSLRLEGFMRMIEREKLDKFQMVGLTMGKLKEMGADAVGPRRKLLHAIDLLCQDSPRWLLW